MIIKRKTQIILALFVSSIFLFQNCATIGRGASQKIPVMSNPSGARIIVDGKEMGYAPLNLKLKKKQGHIIRIEKQGYNPLEIRIARKTSTARVALSFFGSVISGCVGAGVGFLVGMFVGQSGSEGVSFGGMRAGIIIGGLLGFGAALFDSYKSGANYTLSPQELNVTLTRIEGKSQPNFILMDEEQFQNIKWIRIKCADSDRDGIVNLD